MRALATVALIAAAVLGCAGAWLLYTAQGFAWSIAQLGRIAGAALVLEDARGTLSGGMTARLVRYTLEDGTTIEARDVALRLSPASLLMLAPRIAELKCAGLTVTLAPSDTPSRPPVTLALPVEIHVAQASIDRLRIGTADGTVEATKVAFRYSGDAGGHRLRDAAFDLYGAHVSGSGSVGATQPFPVEASLATRRETAPAGSLTAHLKGPLLALQVTARADGAGAQAIFEGTLSPYETQPLRKLRAISTNLDLRVLDPALPRTALEGTLTLDAVSGGSGGMLKGDLRVHNRLAGSWDKERLPLASLEAAVETDLAGATLNGRAALGAAGALAGTGKIGRDGIVLALRAEKLNLAGLHGRLRATQLAGRIDAAFGEKKQAATADLSERDVRIALHAERAGDTVELRDVRARARGGEARGSGRVALSGAQPFTAEARLTAFNPAAWGNFPQGMVNGRLSAKGTLAPHPSLDAALALDPSQLRGAALAGSGRASLRGERITAMQADFDWGGNRVNARGAWGGSGDTLSVGVEAPRLAVVDPDWSGRLSGKAELTGSRQAPGVKFTLSGSGLALTGHGRIETLSARGEYSARIDGPLQLAASAAGMAVRGLGLSRMSLDVDGTRPAHNATLRAQGESMNLTVRLRGGLQPAGGWTGSVQEFENRGQYPVTLEAPVSLDVTPGRVRAGKIAARFASGRLDAGEFRYEDGRITSEGQFGGLRASAILALAGLAPDAAGTVQLGGAWKLSGTPRWNGTVSIRRESGDLSLATQNALPLGLEALTLDARIVDDRVDFRGVLRSRLAAGRIDGSVSPVEGPRGPRFTAASPLKFTSSLEVTRLAALTTSSESSLRLDGRLRAEVSGSGTVGDPLLTGPVEGDDLGIALAQEGVGLKNGVLRAELTGREMLVRSFSIRGGQGTFRAQGTLARGESGRAALDWEAERLAVMERPGRRVVVTGRGKAALEDRKVSLSGTLRADEGEIELRSGGLLAPGDDVVIVGRQPAAADASRIGQALLDLTFDFGDRFRIVGRGLNTFLAGNIRVQNDAAGELTAKGSVEAVRGTYTAFSQRLELERGRLIFAGPIDNPGLDIRAMRKMPEVEAGVEVSGTLRRPVARVVSQPSMSEHDALSWLILGHGPGDENDTDLSMLPLAAAALLGQDEGSGGVARTFGLDSIGLRRSTSSSTSGGASTGTQFITLGKRVSDNVYVVYEQGVGAAASLLKLEFNLTRRVLLRAETGQTSGLGLFYRWAFD